jgi:hypothetical protein
VAAWGIDHYMCIQLLGKAKVATIEAFSVKVGFVSAYTCTGPSKEINEAGKGIQPFHTLALIDQRTCNITTVTSDPFS